jgi:hypothetical protein
MVLSFLELGIEWKSVMSERGCRYNVLAFVDKSDASGLKESSNTVSNLFLLGHQLSKDSHEVLLGTILLKLEGDYFDLMATSARTQEQGARS